MVLQLIIYFLKEFNLFITFSGVNKDTLCVGVARVGSDTQQIITCSLKHMANVNLGDPLHSLIIVGPDLHPLETEYLEQFKL